MGANYMSRKAKNSLQTVFVEMYASEKELKPGDMFFEDYMEPDTYWSNQIGPHLCLVLPNGIHWVIDSRASNCDMKEDKTHRCWVRHGEPPNITVDKRGETCNAGSGSIKAGNFHGFLRNGKLEW